MSSIFNMSLTQFFWVFALSNIFGVGVCGIVASVSYMKKLRNTSVNNEE